MPVSEVNQQHETIAVEQIQLGSFRHHHLSEDCRLKKHLNKHFTIHIWMMRKEFLD